MDDGSDAGGACIRRPQKGDDDRFGLRPCSHLYRQVQPHLGVPGCTGKAMF